MEHKKYKEKAPSVYFLDVSEIVPGAAGSWKDGRSKDVPIERELARQEVANTFERAAAEDSRGRSTTSRSFDAGNPRRHAPFPALCAKRSVVDTLVDHAPGTGATKRRRERRLGAYLRYARMSVAMALAENKHHWPRTRTIAHSARRRPRLGRGERVAQRLLARDSSPQGGKHGVLQYGRRKGCACRPADTFR